MDKRLYLPFNGCNRIAHPWGSSFKMAYLCLHADRHPCGCAIRFSHRSNG